MLRRDRRARRLLAATGVAAVFVPQPAVGSGFLLYEQSARALGMGAAVSAGVRDPSAVWFNPAALAFMGSAGVTAAAAFVAPRTRFAPAGEGAEAESRTGLRVVPNLFGHARVASRVQIGLGVYPPFGLAVDWPDGWVGAEQSLSTDLRVVAANPVVAVRLSEHLAVAAGASLVRGDVALATALPRPPGGRADLAGGAWGAAVNAAVLWRPRPDALHLCAAYRSRTTLAFRGRADFSPETPGFEQMLASQGVSADLTLPDLATLGVMFRPHPRLELDAQVDWTRWSAFDELHIRFEQPALDRRIERSRVDPLTFRLGAEADVRPNVRLRAGASFDQSASAVETLAPSAPDGRRLVIGTGVGLALGKIAADVGYAYAHFLPARAAGPRAKPEGTYRTRAHVLAITLVWMR